MHVLNSAPGYRITGETDNAWIYLGWYARAQLAAADKDKSGASRNATAVLDLMQKSGLSTPAAMQQAAADLRESDLLCSMRQLMLLLHNPKPRARVFGFKEIYSPFVREVGLVGEVFAQGVEFIRVLFPRAKFIFHCNASLRPLETGESS